MVDKGLASRKKEGRAFIFSARVAQDDVSRGMLHDIVDRVFDGSPSAVMVHLLQTSAIDTDEIKRLRKLINKKAKEQDK